MHAPPIHIANAKHIRLQSRIKRTSHRLVVVIGPFPSAKNDEDDQRMPGCGRGEGKSIPFSFLKSWSSVRLSALSMERRNGGKTISLNRFKRRPRSMADTLSPMRTQATPTTRRRPLCPTFVNAEQTSSFYSRIPNLPSKFAIFFGWV